MKITFRKFTGPFSRNSDRKYSVPSNVLRNSRLGPAMQALLDLEEPRTVLGGEEPFSKGR